MAHIGMAYILIACIVMACAVMAYIVMTYRVMVYVRPCCRGEPTSGSASAGGAGADSPCRACVRACACVRLCAYVQSWSLCSCGPYAVMSLPRLWSLGSYGP